MSTSPTSATLEEIQSLNLGYLLLAQRLLREDRPNGIFRLGVSQQIAEVLERLTLAQMTVLASSTQVLCRFRFVDHTVLSAFAQKVQRAPADTQTHTASSLAAQSAEQI